MIKAVLWIILGWLACMYYAIGKQTDEIDWIEMFMQRYKIQGGDEYKLLHFMITEWKKWEKENGQKTSD